MQKIKIAITGVAAELVLGNYMPTDATIMNEWSEFYHYNDVMHDSQLIMSHLREVTITCDDVIDFQNVIPDTQVVRQKTIMPALIDGGLYLKTECVEEAQYLCEFEANEFDIEKVVFQTQDYDHFFKVGTDFLVNIRYDTQIIKPEWVSGKPVGNLCLLCRFENGYLIPIYDAIAKVEKTS